MSNPNRILSHRILPPFTKFRHCNHEDRLIINGHNHSSYFMPNDKYSEESITLFLLSNPTFLETFLIQNYSAKTLHSIISKITNISHDHEIPRQSRISSGILIANTSQHTPILRRTSYNSLHKKKYATPSTGSLVSSMTLSLFPKPENILAIKETVTLIRFNSEDQSGDPNFNNKDRFTTLDDIPPWSRKLFLSHRNINPPDPQEQTNILSKKQLLEEINKDLSAAIKCDGSNLYLVDENSHMIYLSNEPRPNDPNLFTTETLAAYVARERTGVSTPEVFMDDRFPQGILITDSFIQAAMAQPIIMNNDELVGVIEVFKTIGKPPFTADEELIFRNYCMWASIAVFYNEVYFFNIKQHKMNKFLLNVTQKMFGQFQTIDAIIKDIMASAKSLVQAERVSLFLLEKTTQTLVSQIFDKGNYKECIFEVQSNVIRIQMGEGIAGYVAESGETLNITDVYKDVRFNRGIDMMTGYTTRNILCMPVKRNNEIIGVVQMLNKLDGCFTAVDESDFQTFATYCGIALHIAKMYEKIMRSQQKYKVALDVLSYHAGCTNDEFLNLKQMEIPSYIDNIDTFAFWPWSVSSDRQPTYVIFMFKELFQLELMKLIYGQADGFSRVLDCFDEETIMRFVLTVKKNYRSVPYHNWSHAFSVAHSMYVLLKTCNHRFDIFESLALYVGCLCHDLDHRGKTNQFMVQSSSPLSALYSTSTMEHHHFNMTVTILQRDGHNIFKYLSSQNYRKILGHLKHCILATDLAKYFEYRAKLKSGDEFLNPEIESNRQIHMALSMTMCDLCSMYKSWEMQLSLVMIIMKEFWTQGDEELQRGATPIKMLDRKFKLDLPDCQVGFLRDVCLPCYKLVSRLYPSADSVLEVAEDNLSRWQQLASLPPKERTDKINELELFVDEFIRNNRLNFK